MKISTRDLILISMFAALMVVGALIKIPNPLFPLVPITFQLFFCIFAGLLLGARNGFLSQLIYILLGLVGLPVFTGGGGIGYVLKPTFGFIIGFAITAFVIGWLIRRQKTVKFFPILLIATFGLLLAYVIGDLYFLFIINLIIGNEMSFLAVVTTMLPYMIKDLILVVIAATAATIIIPVLRKSGVLTNQ